MNNSIESFIESNYPLASDDIKRITRAAYYACKDFGASLIDSSIPTLAARYNDALDGLRSSHTRKLDELVELGFLR